MSRRAGRNTKEENKKGKGGRTKREESSSYNRYIRDSDKKEWRENNRGTQFLSLPVAR